MLHRLRYAMENKSMFEPFAGVVEVDEVYIGSRGETKHKWKREIIAMQGKGETYLNKTPVFGILQRPNKLMLIQMPGNKVDGTIVKPIIRQKIKAGSIVITDGFGAYSGLKNTFRHSVINHASGEFGRGAFHTNSIEGAFSHLKRSIYGVYHQTSVKHLQAYCTETAFRLSNCKAKEADRFNILLKQSASGALKYKSLVGIIEDKTRYTNKKYRKAI